MFKLAVNTTSSIFLYSNTQKEKHLSVASQSLDALHRRKYTARKINFAEIFNKFDWNQSVKRVALFFYDLCQSGKEWSRQMSQGWIASQLRLSRSTVSLAIKILERLEILKIFRREMGYTHTYQFNLPDWLNAFLNKIPNNKYCKGTQMSDYKTQSNKDLSTYNKYTEYLDSKEGRIETFRKRNPEKAKEYDNKFKNEQPGYIARTAETAVVKKKYDEMLKNAIPKETAINLMAELRKKMGFFKSNT